MRETNGRMTTALSVVAALLLSGGLASTTARAGQITAELDRTEAQLGEAVHLTITIEGQREDEPVLPDVPGLVFHQQGYSESTVISNGRRVSELALTLVVRAQKTGEYTIPSIAAELDGERVASLPLTLRIVPAGSGSAAQGNPSGGAPGANAAGKGSAKGSAGQAKEDTGGVFVERECAKAEPFVGEQVICAIRIFHRGNLNGGQRPGVNSPDFRRFSVEGEARYQRVVGGQRYAVIELKDIVIPTKAGQQTLPPFTLEARVLTWSKRGNPLNKFLDRFGGGMLNFDMNFTEEKQVTIESEPTVFDVKPLPEAGRPAGFQGLVGRFQLTAEASQQEVAVGDTVTISVALAGEGVLDAVAEPAVAWQLRTIGKVYPDKPEYKETIDGETGVRSRKTFRFAVVPDKAGEFPLGKVEVPAFDPTLGDYVVLQAELGTLMVQQGDLAERPLVVGQGGKPADETRQPVQVVASDLVQAHSSASMSPKHTITSSLLWFLFGTSVIPWLGAFSLVGLRALRRRREEVTPESRRSKAFKHFQEALRQARGRENSSPAQTVTAAHRAFKTFVGDKVNRHGTALAAKELDEQLLILGVSESVRRQVREVVAQVERIEFGGQSVTAEERDALLADLEGIAAAMESH